MLDTDKLSYYDGYVEGKLEGLGFICTELGTFLNREADKVILILKEDEDFTLRIGEDDLIAQRTMTLHDYVDHLQNEDCCAQHLCVSGSLDDVIQVFKMWQRI